MKARNVGILLVVTAISVGSLVMWFALPSASAKTKVRYLAGHIQVSTAGAFSVVAHNATVVPRTVTIKVRDEFGGLVGPVSGTNTIADIPNNSMRSRGYDCSSTVPCSFSIEIVTDSTLVVPSVRYDSGSGESMALHAGDFRVKVTR